MLKWLKVCSRAVFMCVCVPSVCVNTCSPSVLCPARGRMCFVWSGLHPIILPFPFADVGYKTPWMYGCCDLWWNWIHTFFGERGKDLLLPPPCPPLSPKAVEDRGLQHWSGGRGSKCPFECVTKQSQVFIGRVNWNDQFQLMQILQNMAHIYSLPYFEVN